MPHDKLRCLLLVQREDIPQDFVQRFEPYYVDRKVAQYVQRPYMQDPSLSFGCPIIHDEWHFRPVSDAAGQ